MTTRSRAPEATAVPATSAASAASADEGSPAPRPAALEARGLTLAYDGHEVLTGLDLAVEPGTVTTLVGANGSGKSTLLKAFGRLLSPAAGEVRLHGAPLKGQSARQVARQLAILPQKPLTPGATRVRDLVSRGRHPHQSMLRPWTAADARAVEEALEATGLSELAERDAASLSGGQLQRAWIALVLAQDAPTILLDEPTTFLDLSHQLDVLRIVRRINRRRGATVVMVLHDLTLAARFSDRLVVLADGGVVADGAPWDVLTPEVLRTAFGLEASVIADPHTGGPLVVPHEPEDETEQHPEVGNQVR
ncbi:ABC transporter ATP-binding protein [Nocardioides sp. GY 10127]|uniref:ABC transporter ATP-binding protein n=1 Tax=Nocardioides sp. GY 10127 TaxID=2569762 RepID=UPI0010A7BFFD|nr:ABC transporter ATP-binding protein [Nocardioides sp. GY 10127]TIC86399.1 ABC transporter ATP-binding protein [Nocardioides sp. GY 10127]